MEFHSKARGGMHLNESEWRSCFKLAETFGWSPAGTVSTTLQDEDVEQGWTGLYFTSDWQKVTDDDARSLGMALERALLARKTNLELTTEQTEALQDAPISLAKNLAMYAAQGWFIMCGRVGSG